MAHDDWLKHRQQLIPEIGLSKKTKTKRLWSNSYEFNF